MNEAAQTHWIWFEWTGQRVGTPRLRQPGGQYLGECPTDIIGPVVKHYNYDGVGRIYRATSPIDAASLPESYIFNSGATAFTRSERFFYDGTRRIQEVVTDPVIVHEEGDVPSINGQILTPPPEGVEEFTRLKTQYVWGPGDSPTSGALELLRVTEITKNASGVTVEYPRLVLYDAQGDVAALVQPPGVGGTAAAAVTAQWTWSPYGEVLTYEEFYPHQPLKVGHKGLFVDRLDTGPLVFDMYTWTAAEPARLMPGAKLIGHTPNRTYSPGLGRWLQQDPNGAGASTVGDSRYHGEAPDAISILIDANRRAGDGLNLFGYLGQNPLSRSDPMGLSWDPFDDMVYDFVATNAAQQAAFMEQLRGGFNSAAHLAWQVAQLHPAVGVAVAGYNLATGNFSAWDLLALVPGGAAAKSLSKAVGVLHDTKALYETSRKIGSGVNKAKIGATGVVGEAALKAMGGTSQAFFRTGSGKARYVDQLVGNVAHEAKTGYASLAKEIREQIAKDVELIREGQINSSVWHFFESPATLKKGPSAPLLSALQAAGIQVIIH